MRVIKNVALGFVLVFSAVVCASGQTQPRTVTEFYLMLPGSINGIEGTQETEVLGFENDFLFYANERNESKAAIVNYRKSLIKIEDTKNGYLRLESDKWKGWVEVALFKKADGTSLIAISQVACAAKRSGGVMFCTYKNGHWQNVTGQVLPDSSSRRGYYTLPRVGTSITLLCGGDGCPQGNKLAEFQWDKEKFIKK